MFKKRNVSEPLPGSTGNANLYNNEKCMDTVTSSHQTMDLKPQFQTSFYPSAPPPWFTRIQAQLTAFQLRLDSRLTDMSKRMNVMEDQLNELSKPNSKDIGVPQQRDYPNVISASRRIETMQRRICNLERELGIARNRLKGDGSRQPFEIIRFDNMMHPIDYKLPALLKCEVIDNLSPSAMKLYLRGYGISEKVTKAETKRALAAAIGCYMKYPYK